MVYYFRTSLWDVCPTSPGGGQAGHANRFKDYSASPSTGTATFPAAMVTLVAMLLNG